MLKSNLSVLLAERGLKIVDLYNATGISKTTLLALSENTSKGVQFETVDKLCNYLGVTPAEFFTYAPYLINYRIEKGNPTDETWFPFYEADLVLETEQGAKNRLYRFGWGLFSPDQYNLQYPGSNAFGDNYQYDFHMDIVDRREEKEENFARLLESTPIQIEREIVEKMVGAILDYLKSFFEKAKLSTVTIEIVFTFEKSKNDNFTKIVQYKPAKNELTIIK